MKAAHCRQALALALVLTGAALAAAQAAGDATLSLNTPQAVTRKATPNPLDTITICDLVTTIAGGASLPRDGTMFCPSNTAWESFARASGFANWAAMWAKIQEAPDNWKAYFGRIIDYHTLPGVVLSYMDIMFDEANPMGPYETSLVTSRDADGNPTARAAMSISKTGAGKLTLLAANNVRGAAVVGLDLMVTEGISALHTISVVMMPPDTFHTLSRALRGNKDLSTTGSYLNSASKAAVASAATFGTLIAPTNAAWRAMRYVAPIPTWTGGVSAAVLNQKDLRTALMKYLLLPLPRPAGGAFEAAFDEAVTREKLIAAWQLAGSSSFVAMPSALEVDGQKQTMLYTYDPASDSIFFVGGRNTGAPSTMAGGKMGAKTVYAGCATLLSVDTNVPLPVKTGIARFDQGEPPKWWIA